MESTRFGRSFKLPERNSEIGVRIVCADGRESPKLDEFGVIHRVDRIRHKDLCLAIDPVVDKIFCKQDLTAISIGDELLDAKRSNGNDRDPVRTMKTPVLGEEYIVNF